MAAYGSARNGSARELNEKINVCKKCYFERKTTFLTLQNTFMFAGVLAQDEFVEVFHILVHIVTCYIVTVLLLFTKGEKNNQIAQTENTDVKNTGILVIIKQTFDVVESLR